jgi:hypothetical protein
MAVMRVQAVLVGIVSTMSMDVLTVVASRLKLTAPLAPNLVGRWFASVARVQPFHTDIARTAPVGHELAIAVPVHYAIGVVLASAYLWGTTRQGWPTQSLGLALMFGLSTNVFPWLLMFPAMGYGFFGLNGPLGTRLFVSSLFSHASFGLSLWIAIRMIA